MMTASRCVQRGKCFRRVWFTIVASLTLGWAFSNLARGEEPVATDYQPAIAEIEKLVRQEMRDWEISGLTLVLFDDQTLVHSGAYGTAKTNSIFRVGSISKLFNAVAVMQLVETGKLELDAPLERYAPGKTCPNPFKGTASPTLRQVLCHRSGMMREAPTGGYLDLAQPGLEATINSYAGCPLATAPNTKTRYSNSAPSLAGWIVSQTVHRPFEDHLRDAVLTPLDMHDSTYVLKQVKREQLLPSSILVANNKGEWDRRETPVFDLGTIPAGNLFSTAEDLSKFGRMLLAGGAWNGKQILAAKTLEQMLQPQLTDEDTGFGIAFILEKLGDRMTVGHNGAVYGGSSLILVLPKEKIGIVVLANDDIVNSHVHKIASSSLQQMLAAKFKEAVPPDEPAVQLPAPQLAALAGNYESESFWSTLAVEGDHLIGKIGGQPVKFVPTGKLTCLVNGRLHADAVATFVEDETGRVTGFKLGLQEYARVEKPETLPEDWQRFVGSYGPDLIPLIVAARFGHLYAMTENMVEYRLRPVARGVFGMPLGLYTDEYVVFSVDDKGQPLAATLANMYLPRHRAAEKR